MVIIVNFPITQQNRSIFMENKWLALYNDTKNDFFTAHVNNIPIKIKNELYTFHY